MARIIDKINAHLEQRPEKPFFSFEFFPPKTDIGVVNLYERFERMARLQPMWIDVTWGAGGSTAEKTLEICGNGLKYHGLDVMMHLTCTDMKEDEIYKTLCKCKELGICNILALRGDPPANSESWKAVDGGFSHAIDLVRYIKTKFGEYFCIAVAGYPEGHLEAESREQDLIFLKQKVDAGASFVVTQLFYDNDEFCEFVKRCRKVGIPESVIIVPGIMPIQSYSGFKKMTEFCQTSVPKKLTDDLELQKGDEQRVKDFGVDFAVEQCTDLFRRKDVRIHGLHFYTLNLESSVCRIIEQMQLVDEWHARRELPWRIPTDKTREEERVRPIFWANRPQSYIKRTATWDDFPNGRFGNKDSAAYGDIESAFVSYSKESLQKVQKIRREMWGEELSKLSDVQNAFVKFLKNDIKRLPWCAEGPTKETNFIFAPLLKLNQLGALTINSQPRVNGSLSTDPYVGWGPSGGFVYQKAYVEFFMSPSQLQFLLRKIEEEKLRQWTYCAFNRAGDRISNTATKSITAITWGVFPGSEVLQPTVCDNQSFNAWKDEAFDLWSEWLMLYPEGSKSREIVKEIQETYYLVNVVDNDFVAGDLFTTLVWLLSNQEVQPLLSKSNNTSLESINCVYKNGLAVSGRPNTIVNQRV